ncbi:hypothetical protein EXN22_18210 [Pseudomonas tructae]|uniref:Uncharacterized protein n=1 Tax=Pseudomonas tructae TaxID=2518644 RepID=A0A411ML47_9PSED|nr:hypothetical protein [Pseudomonas tructae]QBF27523.1 hypothetical protein EXN22_18210 [Pseudomonas tructae]
MSITITLNLASGDSAKGMVLELLSDGLPVARAKVDDQGNALFHPASTAGRLAVRVDRSDLNREHSV